MEQQRQIYDIGPFRSSVKNKDTQLNVYVSDKHFKIDVFEDELRSSPAILKEYLRQVSRQEPDFIPEADEDGFYEDTLDEMHDWILRPFMPIFRSLPPLDTSRRYTLQDCLFAEELHYRVKAEENELVPVFLEESDGKENHLVGAQLPPSNIDYSMFPFYSPRDIHVAIDEKETSLTGVPRQVFLPGRAEPCFFKIVYAGDVGITLRELRTYSKIRAIEAGNPIRTPQLHGIVQDDRGSIMGLLLSYIDSGGSALSCIDVSDPQYSGLPQKWFDQISRTLEVLHAHGIVWGDAKADNVLIDLNENAYLIDFGGGYTEGWVDKGKSDSIEGDLQGLQHIKEFLFP